MDNLAEIITDHYQKTYELTYELWRQRNRIFLVLLGVIGVATLLTFRVLPQTNSLIVDLIARGTGINEENRIEELRKSFPFGILQSILLLVIFYLMVNLYHRALYVLRNYRYLGALESEIRQHLGLRPEAIAFTREGKFYWNERPYLLGKVKWVYIGLLGVLLLVFLVGRVTDDLRTNTLLLAIVDFVIAALTFVYFIAYAIASISLDTRTAVVHGDSNRERVTPASDDST